MQTTTSRGLAARSLKQQGFTLIELIIVVAVLGVLAAIFAPKLASPKDSASGRLMENAAQGAAEALRQIAQTCGLTTAVSSTHPVLASSKTMEDLIFTGTSAVAAAYTTCYSQSKVLPLNEVAQPGATTGTYNVAGYQVVLGGGGTTPLTITYKAVPDSIVLEMAQRFNPSLSALATSDSTSDMLQYGTATGGTRDVTFRKRLS